MSIPSASEIRVMRAARGLSQFQAARLIGMNRDTWSRWETGKSSPSRFVWPKLRIALAAWDKAHPNRAPDPLA